MEEEVGRIIHYFSKINVGVLEVSKGKISKGDTIHIKGHTTDFYQKVESLQIEHSNVDSAEMGQSVGLRVESPVRENDIVMKVTSD